MKDIDRRVQTFVSWVHDNAARLRAQPARAVADELGDAALQVHGQLGVEVADEDDGAREVIVTAFSDPSLFPLVRRIVDLLSDVSGWSFVCLKQPRGFAFTLEVGECQLDAEMLGFAPLSEIPGGIRLIAREEVLAALPPSEEAEELAWLIVETGVGEELAGQVQHVEFASAEEVVSDRRPIEELAGYLREAGSR
jgi:hypothetical protein